MHVLEQITPTSLADYLEMMSKAVFQSGISWRVVESKEAACSVPAIAKPVIRLMVVLSLKTSRPQSSLPWAFLRT